MNREIQRNDLYRIKDQGETWMFVVGVIQHVTDENVVIYRRTHNAYEDYVMEGVCLTSVEDFKKKIKDGTYTFDKNVDITNNVYHTWAN